MTTYKRLASIQQLALEAGQVLFDMTRHDDWLKGEFNAEERDQIYRARELLLTHQPAV